MHTQTLFKKHRLALAVAGTLFGLGSHVPLVWAADGEPENAALDTVVITATKRVEKLQEVPAAVTAISGADIQDAELRSTRDVARFVPAAQGWNTESRARPRFFIRGVGSNEATNNSVNPIGFYTDQVYYNNNLFHGSPLFDLQQVEVLRGPQGTLWGKNTTGGAFHFISRKPTFNTDGYARFEAGSYGTRIAEGAIGGELQEGVLAGRAAVHYEERGGLATNTTSGRDVGDFRDFAGRFQLLALVSSDFDASLGLSLRNLEGTQNPWYSVTRQGAPDLYGYVAPIGKGTGDRRHVAYNLDLPLRVETQGLNLTLNWAINGLTLTSITAIDHGRRWGLIDSDYTPYEYRTGANARSYNRNSVTQESQEFRLASRKEQDLSWIVGAYFFHDKNDSFGTNAKLTGVTGTQSYNYTEYTQDTRSTALFGSAAYRVTDRFKLNGGVRYTRESVGIDLSTRIASSATAFPVAANWWSPDSLGSATSSTYFSTNGRVENSWSNVGYDLTPEYRLADNQLVYLRHASGFRSGNYNTYITPNGVPGVSQFSVVKPEKLKSYEIGYKSTWLDQRLTFNSSAFHYDYKDMQLVVNQVFGSTFYPTLMNAGAGEVDGIEFETLFQATSALKLRANLSSLRTRFNELQAGGRSYAGYNFARVPRVTSLLGADYRLPVGGGTLLLGTDWSYTSQVNFNVTDNTDPYAIQESFWLGNLRAAYTLPGNKVIVGAYVNNVTDQRYKTQAMLYQGGTNATNGHYPTGYGDPRTAGLTLTLKY